MSKIIDYYNKFSPSDLLSEEFFFLDSSLKKRHILEIEGDENFDKEIKSLLEGKNEDFLEHEDEKEVI